MKNIKWNIVLAIVLCLTMCVSAAMLAAAQDVQPSEQVQLELSIDGKDGIQGENITFSNPDMIESFSLDVNGEDTRYENNKFFWHTNDNVTVKLHINVKISENAQPGDTCEVSLAYRTSASELPDEWADYGWTLVVPQPQETPTEAPEEPSTAEPTTPPGPPPMGESGSTVVWMGLMIFAGLGLVMMTLTRKKAEN